MSPESVGDALSKVCSWLRPAGLLVNIQPAERPMRLEVSREGDREPLGRVLQTRCGRRNIRSASEMLSATIAAGVFSPGPKVERDLAFHYATLEDWQEFLERPRTGTVEADPVKLESALLEVSRSDDVEVVVTEETGFSLFERNSSDCPA